MYVPSPRSSVVAPFRSRHIPTISLGCTAATCVATQKVQKITYDTNCTRSNGYVFIEQASEASWLVELGIFRHPKDLFMSCGTAVPQLSRFRESTLDIVGSELPSLRPPWPTNRVEEVIAFVSQA